MTAPRKRQAIADGDGASAGSPSSSAPLLPARDRHSPTEPTHYIVSAPYNAARTLAGSAERISIKPTIGKVAKRPSSAWQTAAWGYFESIGEIHFALSLIGQLVSRVRVYAGIIDDPTSEPTDARSYLQAYDDRGLDPKLLRMLLNEASRLTNNLFRGGDGTAQMLREMTLGLAVPGEFYLVQKPDGEWITVSNDELVGQPGGKAYKLRLDRTDRSSTMAGNNKKAGEIELGENSFIARVWRSHPRYSNEPDSSMMGVLDECELLTVLNQTMRGMLRSQMNAGIVFIPDGLVDVASEEGATLTDSIVKMARSAIEDEAATATVVPLVVSGPAELGKSLAKIELGRRVDDTLVSLADRTLERILVGIDVPKEIVQGFADVKYANALIIDDALFRAHIEPLALLIVDSLTKVYLRPMLNMFVAKHPELGSDMVSALLDRIVLWFDASALITRPDMSTAANEGVDRYLLSEKAWRQTRGFSEADAPTNEEKLERVALSRATIAPDQASVLLEALNPKLFQTARAAGQAESEFPPDLANVLEGGQPTGALETPRSSTPTPSQEAPPSPLETARQGGEIVSPAGNQPPRG